MPHPRYRYAQDRLKKVLKFSPIAGVVGQRQVGKTTLIEACSHAYVTLDRERSLLEAEANPELFVHHHESPYAIDEAQLCPRLFPALKEAVRVNKKPGQYILSGSVRFTSREQIRESLTGRIVTMELLPFSIDEAHDLPLSDRLVRILATESFHQLDRAFGTSRSSTEETRFENHLRTGGLPGICFFRDASVRREKFEAQLDTLLNRDLRLVSRTNLPYTALRALLAFLASMQGRAFDLKAAADASQISTVSIKKLLAAFEALFLIRFIRSLDGERKGSYFLEDQGLATWLMDGIPGDAWDICRGLYSSLRHELHYRPDRNGRIQQFRTKHGVNVPLVFAWTHGMVGIIPTVDSTPTPKTTGSALAFLKRYPRAKAVIATSGSEVVFKNDRLFWIPYSRLVCSQ